MILLIPAAFAANLAGTVSDVDGAPIPGATVVAYDTRLSYAQAQSTNDGGWGMGGVPPGRYRLRVLPDDADPHVDRFWPDTWDFCAADVVVLDEGGDIEGLDFALPVGGTLTGTVTEPSGARALDGQILAQGMSERTSLVSRLADIAEDGTFRIVGLDSEAGQSEPYSLYLNIPGLPRQYLAPSYDDEEAAWFDVTRGGETSTGDQSLLEGISVSGTVRGPDGPVVGGTVYVYSGSQVMSCTTGDDGVYTAERLPPGDIITWASGDGLATTYYPDADRPGGRVAAPDEGADVTGVDLTLPRESTLTVTVVGGAALDDASVLLYNDTYTVGRGGGLAADGTITIDALFPGTYFLFVYGDDAGLTDDWARDAAGEILSISVDGATEITVAPPGGASFSGTVRGDDGAPVYGAYVYATTLDASDTVVATTDHDGVYSLTGLVGGTYTLRASYVHYCPNDPGWVTTYWPDALVVDDGLPTELASGEARTEVDFTLFRDDDHDAMGDVWEEENGLDPTRDDAGEDADGDGYLNIEEWVLGSDPTGGDAGSTGCGAGCGSGAAVLGALPLALRRRRAACTGAPRSLAFRW